MRQLNRMLRPRYLAAFQVHPGTQVEADVAEFDRGSTNEPTGNGAGGVAVAAWAPPAATLTLPALFPDDIEVQVIDTRDGATLVVVDIVTNRSGNLHNELMDRLRYSPDSRLTGEGLYAASYRPVRRAEQNLLDVWLIPLVVGRALPTMPLALRGAGCVPLELETTYGWAREDSGL
jgi:hypothetical protein